MIWDWTSCIATAEDGYRVCFSGKKDKHEYGSRFLIQKGIMNTDVGFKPVSNRFIRLRTPPFSITILQGHALTPSHEKCYVELHPKMPFWYFKEIICHSWQGQPDRLKKKQQNKNKKTKKKKKKKKKKTLVGNPARVKTNDEDESSKNMGNILDTYKPSQRWTWHSPDRNDHNRYLKSCWGNASGLA